MENNVSTTTKVKNTLPANCNTAMSGLKVMATIVPEKEPKCSTTAPKYDLPHDSPEVTMDANITSKREEVSYNGINNGLCDSSNGISTANKVMCTIVDKNHSSPQNKTHNAVDKKAVQPNKVMCTIVDKNASSPQSETYNAVDETTVRPSKVMCTIVNKDPKIPGNKTHAEVNNRPAIPVNKQIVLQGDDQKTFTFDGKNTCFIGTPFMNAMIRIVDVIVCVDSGYYVCDICISNGTHVQKRVPIIEYSTGKWLSGMVGIQFFCKKSEAKDLIYMYLQSLIGEFDFSAEKTTMFNESGWRNVYGKYYYVTKNGAIGHPEFKCLAEFGQNFTKLGFHNDYYSVAFKRYLEAINVAGATSCVGPILMLYTSMSFCHELFKLAGVAPKFVLFLHGLRGSFKTSLGIALTQIQFSVTPRHSLRDTKAYIETLFKEYKDCAILVDDLAPVGDQYLRNNMEATLDTVVRAYGDGKVRDTCTWLLSEAKAKKRSTISSGGAVITGEYYTGCESSLARCLLIEADRDSVNVQMLGALQNHGYVVEEYAIALITYLTTMLNNNEDILGYIRNRVDEIRNNHIDKFVNPRYAEYLAHLQTTADLVLLVAQRFNILSESDMAFYKSRFEYAIQYAIADNNERTVKREPITVACTAIYEAIKEGKAKLTERGNINDDMANTILCDDRYYYVTQRYAANLANQYIKENEMLACSFTATYIAQTFEKDGVITVFSEGDTVRRATKLPGYGSIRYMQIDKAKLMMHVKL